MATERTKVLIVGESAYKIHVHFKGFASYETGYLSAGLEGFTDRFADKPVSFVSLGDALHVNGNWCGTGGTNLSGCNIYNPPTRAWNFDPGFNNAANLPPLTPRFVYVQQVLFTEDFK